MTPLERAARALGELDIRGKRKWDTSPDELERMLPAALDYAWGQYVEQVRAVVAAIREPSEDMLSAGINHIPQDSADEDDLRLSFSVMIDALLEEGK